MILRSLAAISLTFFVCSCSTAKTNRAPSQEAPKETAAPHPKYDLVSPVKGPAAVRLFDSHDFIKTHDAPDFWAMMPYYIPQQKGTCAASTLTTVLNALNAHKKLTADDKLVTVDDLITKVNDPLWQKSMQEEKCYGLDSLAGVVKVALQKFGHEGAELQIVHVDDSSAATKARLRKHLLDNEKSAHNFIIANFLQGQFTGDPEGMKGHVSPVAAYDAVRHRVLVLDVDREYYEPYWVTEDIFLAGLNTKDEGAAKFRGYIMIKDK